MNEREQILAAIKKGILSSEEGLDLLEHLEKKPAAVDQSAEAVIADMPLPAELGTEKPEESKPTMEAEPEFPQEKTETVVIEAGSKSDSSTVSASKVAEKAELKIKPASQPTDSVTSLLNEWEHMDTTESTNPQDSVTEKIDELDQALQTKSKQLRDNQEEYRELNLEAELGIISVENQSRYQQLKEEIEQLESEIRQLKQARETPETEYYTASEETPNFFGIPDDFDQQHYPPLNRSTEEPQNFVGRLERLMSKTVQTVSETVSGSGAFKDIDKQMPQRRNVHFSHQFLFESIDATLLDIKLAKGKVILKAWTDETVNDVKVDAEVTLFAAIEDADPLEAFLERSQIEIDDDQILFHVPNKRVEAAVTFYLPRRHYQQAKLQLLTSDLRVEELAAKEVLIKSTAGTIRIDDIDATSLEIQGTNNQIELRAGDIFESTIETVNGTIISKAAIISGDYATINGDIKITAGNETLKKIKASAVDGDVKVALPRGLGLKGTGKTDQGTINYRFANCETIQERNEGNQKTLHFQRFATETAKITVSSKTGNIFLKDSNS
ncbi:MAG: daptomycin-sensing surface protein LiaX [Enterococcus viikkiensis]